MIIGKRYQDTMDRTRTLVPVSVDGTSRVYFEGRYSGKAQVPPKLFNDAGEGSPLNYYGFNPCVSLDDTLV